MITQLTTGVTEAATAASATAQTTKSLEGPRRLVSGAEKALSDAIDAYRNVKDSDGFDPTSFTTAVKKLKETYDAFTHEIDAT